MSLGGVVASIALTLNPANPPTGKQTLIPLTVTSKDAAGQIIIGNDKFSNPITIADSDVSGATVVSPATLNTPQDQPTVNYNGSAIASAVFSATSANVQSANITSATLTPSAGTTSPATLVDWPQYGFDAQRTGYNPSSTALTPATVGQLHRAWHTYIGGGSQTQPVIATNIAGHQALLIVAGYKNVYAYDALSGIQIWSRPLPTQFYQECYPAGTGGTVAYDSALASVYISAGNGTDPNHVILYRLSVTDGSITGQTDVTPTLLPGESAGGHTAITLANGTLYLGTGSNCEGTSGSRPAWRGRVVAVNPSSMSLINTFFTTFGHGGNFAGGGVWGWGGVSVDPSGNVYVATGNAATRQTISPGTLSAPFDSTDNEQAGYAEHLVKLSSDLSTVEGSDYPGFNFAIGGEDLDYTGVPVVFTPPFSSNCGGTLTATQGKGGTLVVNNTQQLSPSTATFNLSVPNAAAFYAGNPAYSPATGLLYAAITSSGGGSSMLPPGLAAIGNCGTTIAWHTSFGPDSVSYGDDAHPARSAPTVTAGGVVLMGTPCTPDANGGCGTPNPSNIKGALWAVDAANRSLLGNGKPLRTTTSNIRMPATVDGNWVWLIDEYGDIDALTIDPSIKTDTTASTIRATQRYQYRAH